MTDKPEWLTLFIELISNSDWRGRCVSACGRLTRAYYGFSLQIIAVNLVI